MGQIWSKAPPSYRESYGAAEEMVADGRIIEAYQFYNDPETQIMAVNNDFRAAIGDDQAERYGRIYNSWYQVRNLRMVSNIVAATANEPGARVLSVVGASHKVYFEALLDMMHDIEVVSTDTILK
ncbi:MAG: DUF5694 domain-containing protein [Pseudomonadota bacterium]